MYIARNFVQELPSRNFKMWQLISSFNLYVTCVFLLPSLLYTVPQAALSGERSRGHRHERSCGRWECCLGHQWWSLWLQASPYLSLSWASQYTWAAGYLSNLSYWKQMSVAQTSVHTWYFHVSRMHLHFSKSVKANKYHFKITHKNIIYADTGH